jgi:hypothetical protein
MECRLGSTAKKLGRIDGIGDMKGVSESVGRAAKLMGATLALVGLDPLSGLVKPSHRGAPGQSIKSGYICL